jgi:fatty acid desaturase
MGRMQPSGLVVLPVRLVVLAFLQKPTPPIFGLEALLCAELTLTAVSRVLHDVGHGKLCQKTTVVAVA